MSVYRKMSESDATMRPRKLCFVTVGATAPFHELVRCVLRGPFLDALRENGYTDMLIQHGKGGAELLSGSGIERDDLGCLQSRGVSITGFDFQPSLDTEMSAVRAAAYGFNRPGCMISHAGTGSILEGLRQNLVMIVVANPALLDNHQEDLAEELARQGYVVHGKLESAAGDAGVDAGAIELSKAITQCETLRKQHYPWPPVNSGGASGSGSLAAVMDEEAGFSRLD